MTWTYEGDPAVSSLAAVRFHIGDTNTRRQLLSDEEINYILSEESNTRKAAISCLVSLIAKFSTRGDLGLGRYRWNVENVIPSLREALRILRIQSTDGKSFYSGSSQKEPIFRRGIHDNEGRKVGKNTWD